jgi:hypothetical protein
MDNQEGMAVDRENGLALHAALAEQPALDGATLFSLRLFFHQSIHKTHITNHFIERTSSLAKRQGGFIDTYYYIITGCMCVCELIKDHNLTWRD